MKWNLRELGEDCFVSYLEGEVTGQLKVFPAWGFSEPEYPCAVVRAGGLAPIVEGADWHDARYCDFEIVVMTDAADEIDAQGNIVKSARDRHSDASTLVLAALFKSGLLESVNGKATTGIAFSMAQAKESEPDVDAEQKKLITRITVETIVEPVTGS